MRYRTPDDVRAIPNRQWERWVRGEEPLPGIEFSSEWAVQKTLTTILDATQRRIGIRPQARRSAAREREKRAKKAKAASDKRIDANLQTAYRLLAGAVAFGRFLEHDA